MEEANDARRESEDTSLLDADYNGGGAAGVGYGSPRMPTKSNFSIQSVSDTKQEENKERSALLCSTQLKHFPCSSMPFKTVLRAGDNRQVGKRTWAINGVKLTNWPCNLTGLSHCHMWRNKATGYSRASLLWAKSLALAFLRFLRFAEIESVFLFFSL